MEEQRRSANFSYNGSARLALPLATGILRPRVRRCPWTHQIRFLFA